ncbi:MAG: Holliday junction resolvase RuvX [Anaerolineaceae bacterium]|nr:Holliday junction resolvase RuvX [Anaerolineaceae bacterium]
MIGRILGVDPGEKRIGLALSDPTLTIASPLVVLKHISRRIDAASIAQLAVEHDVMRIIVGQALDGEGLPTPQARHAARLAEAIREQTSLPVQLWDESGSTQAARASRIAMGVSRRKRGGHLDEIAATVILQSYLDVVHDQNTRQSGGNSPLENIDEKD